jgi:hypothetical protein
VPLARDLGPGLDIALAPELLPLPIVRRGPSSDGVTAELTKPASLSGIAVAGAPLVVFSAALLHDGAVEPDIPSHLSRSGSLPSLRIISRPNDAIDLEEAPSGDRLQFFELRLRRVPKIDPQDEIEGLRPVAPIRRLDR